ncbi:MAG TPA: hypothetical protein VIM22_11130, partial [Solirubrobacteraceae bacterium]
MPSRIRHLLTVTAALLAPLVVLCAGIWIGGHPASLPGPLRDVFVSKNVRTINEAIDVIQQDYYRRVPRSRLVDNG